MQPQEVRIDPLLNNVMTTYKSRNLIAEEFFPTVYVDTETGIYFVRDRENLRIPDDDNRADHARANRVSNHMTKATYSLDWKGLETAVSDRTKKQEMLPFNSQKNAVELVTNKMDLKREQALFNRLNGLTGPNVTALTGGDQWSTASADIIGQSTNARDYIIRNTGGLDPNTVILGKSALDSFEKNAQVIERIKYTGRATPEVVRGAVADFLGVERVLIGKGAYENSKEGANSTNATRQYIWNDIVVFAYVAPAPDIENPTAGYNLRLKEFDYVDSWYEQPVNDWIFRSNAFYKDHIVDPDCMFIYKDVNLG